MRELIFVTTLACTISGCGGDSGAAGPSSGPERLTAKPNAATVTAAAGSYPLSVTATKDARIIIPPTTANAAVPLLVMLHGAGGDEAPVDQVALLAAERGIAVMIPRSRQATWDLALAGFGEDVINIDRALQETFKRVRVEPNRIALAGFSDGASYALTLGIANGDLFTHIIALSPGFMSPVNRVGLPNIFIAHGTQDIITSPRNSEQNIAPFLRALGYTVQFQSFNGGHQVNAAEVDLALNWFVGSN
jgi:phospholipase/carboxylesterase